MKPVFIFRHIDIEGPGYLGDVLDRRGIPYRVVRVDAGDPIPDPEEQCAGLVFLGGPMSVNDDLPWIPRELALIRRAYEEQLPMLGHCLGGQLIARALGARVYANPVKEIGWHEVQRLNSRHADELLGELPSQFEVFHWHGETFEIPQGGSPILKSRHCPHQAFVMGKTLALQFHTEINAEMVRQWSQRYQQELLSAAHAPSVQSLPQMLENIAARISGLQRVADIIYDRWLGFLPKRQ